MPRFPWLKMRKKTDPEFPYEPPIPIGRAISNGEFFREPTGRELRIRRLILDKCDENARRLGIDRREFVASAMGMVTTMAVLNACSDDSKGDGGGSGGSGGLPPEATCDEGLALELVGGNGDEFILDLQTHHIEDEEHWRESHPDRPWPGPALSFLDFLGRDAKNIGNAAYLQKVFLESETTVAVLSGFPSEICDTNTYCNSPISNESMVISRDEINALAGGSQRVVQHCQIAPNDYLDKQLAHMEAIKNTYGNHGWKCYPPWGPPTRGIPGWWLDDALNMAQGREVVADKFFQKVVDLTPSAPVGSDPMVYPQSPLLCIHKGFVLPSFEAETARPIDVGAAASKWPQINFVIYHSAIDDQGGRDRGPFNEADPHGIDELCRQVRDNGLKGKNVFAELGSVWASVMNNATSRQHVLGKLLTYLGEDNVVWGSECTWFGSPQPQIEIFRMTEITPEFQAMYGYPALTPELKRKILGLNAAKIYNIDVEAVRCKVAGDELTKLRKRMDAEFGPRRWAFQEMGGPRTRREFMRLQQWKRFKALPG